tara:strand:+ start:18676 stop:18912 length:237 start_codon:yes stop_codon:yes gene_type:complete
MDITVVTVMATTRIGIIRRGTIAMVMAIMVTVVISATVGTTAITGTATTELREAIQQTPTITVSEAAARHVGRRAGPV